MKLVINFFVFQIIIRMVDISNQDRILTQRNNEFSFQSILTRPSYIHQWHVRHMLQILKRKVMTEIFYNNVTSKIEVIERMSRKW
jgi:hypothetical protein